MLEAIFGRLGFRHSCDGVISGVTERADKGIRIWIIGSIPKKLDHSCARRQSKGFLLLLFGFLFILHRLQDPTHVSTTYFTRAVPVPGTWYLVGPRPYCLTELHKDRTLGRVLHLSSLFTYVFYVNLYQVKFWLLGLILAKNIIQQ